MIQTFSYIYIHIISIGDPVIQWRGVGVVETSTRVCVSGGGGGLYFCLFFPPANWSDGLINFTPLCSVRYFGLNVDIDIMKLVI